MKRFDVTFKGQLLPRREPEQVKAGFAELFQIKDPGMLEEIFSGQAVILRSNLDRKTAAEYFMKMNKLGAVAELVPSAASMREHTNGEKHAAQINGIQPHIVVAFEEHDGRQAGKPMLNSRDKRIRPGPSVPHAYSANPLRWPNLIARTWKLQS